MGELKSEDFENILFSDLIDENSEFIPIIADGSDSDLRDVEGSGCFCQYYRSEIPFYFGRCASDYCWRKKSLKLIKDVYKGSRLLGTIAQKDYKNDDPRPIDLYDVGTVVRGFKNIGNA